MNINQQISYTSRDYLSIYDDLVRAAGELSTVWTSRSETDPGMVLIKLMAMLGDVLSYMQDKKALEVYPSTVTERKNAAVIYKLLGYKMNWYHSARTTLTITNNSPYRMYIPRYTRVATSDNSIEYVITEETLIDTMKSLEVEAYQGKPIVPGISTSGDYYYNLQATQFNDNNIYYLPDNNVDSSLIRLVDNTGTEWDLVDNLELLAEMGRYFEFDVDSDDNAYIRLVPYWSRYGINRFQLYYIISDGTDGNVSSGSLTKFSTSVYAERYGGTRIENLATITNTESIDAANPETPSEAFIEAQKYVNTYDTLITLLDYRRAILRLDHVANVATTDFTNDPITDNMLSYTMKFYIVRDDGEAVDDNYAEYIVNSLRSYKALPISISAGSPIYYAKWTPKGYIHLRKPVDQLTATNILNTINEALSDTYAPNKVDFGEKLMYVDIINTIVNCNNNIIYTDIDPITYTYETDEGTTASLARVYMLMIKKQLIDITCVPEEYKSEVEGMLTEDELEWRLDDPEDTVNIDPADLLDSSNPFNIITIPTYVPFTDELVIHPDSIVKDDVKVTQEIII